MTGNTPHHQVLAELAATAKSYLEIGVQEGGSLAAVVKVNPAIDVTLCDPWDNTHGGTGRGNHNHIEVLLDKLGHTGQRIYLDGFSTDMIPAIPKVGNGQFDIVHVDGDHSLEGCKMDLKMCWPLCGGTMVVHDYFFGEVLHACVMFMEWRHFELALVLFSAHDHGTLVLQKAQP